MHERQPNALQCSRPGVPGWFVRPPRPPGPETPTVSWKQYQQRLPTTAEVDAWFSNNHAMCILTGAVSGNLEMLDFDAGGEMYDRWAELVESQLPGLLSQLVLERSQRGGRHIVYRCTEPVCGNLKLAQRPGNDGRPFTLIETRGEGGLFLCAPSPGYELLRGIFTNLPVLTAEQRDILLSAAWSLNEHIPNPEPTPTASAGGSRPGDDFAERGDVRALLVKHGWTLAKAGENEYWRRPGKDSGWSATLKDRVFYVFSANAAPFEPGKAYGPFGMYTLLEHNGDFAAAASCPADGRLRPGHNRAERGYFKHHGAGRARRRTDQLRLRKTPARCRWHCCVFPASWAKSWTSASRRRHTPTK